MPVILVQNKGVLITAGITGGWNRNVFFDFWGQYARQMHWRILREQAERKDESVMMKNYSKKDIMELVSDEDVEFIRLQFTDMFGSLKNVAVTASQLEKALNNECMFDGSSIEGFVRIEESDMYLHPDLSTLEIFPGGPSREKWRD